MQPKLFIEVDAGKEQPPVDTETQGQYSVYVIGIKPDGKCVSCFFDFKYRCWIHERGYEMLPPAFWLRPIQQQEGLAIEFAEWTQKKHYHSWVDVIQGCRLWSNYSPGDERHDKNLTTSELFKQFINSIK